MKEVPPFNIAVLISGSGTNLQAIIDASERGDIPNAKVALVVSNREGAFGLQRAEKHGIANIIIDKNDIGYLLDTLYEFDIHGIVLAGYLSIIPADVISVYQGRIINIHPALLPDFGGMGYYGIKVHEAVLRSGVTETGATAHIVECGVDTGANLVQCKVPVLPGDDAKTLQARVLKTEHKVLIEAVRALARGKIDELAKDPIMLAPKRVLVIGSGGREHAIGWSLNQNPDVELYFAPGNGGTAQLGSNVDIKVDEIEKLADFAQKYHIHLTVVGPELPLVLGIADVFRERGLRIFAPCKRGAQLEGSKAFAKSFMQKYGIPTARYDEVTSLDEGKSVLERSTYPVVIKADGLAAGKGVVICTDKIEAENTLRDMLEAKVFGQAGSRVVIEEYLTGKEVSLLCFTDGETINLMETASDYKRALDGDMGLNTGGMGCISPSPYYTHGQTDGICSNNSINDIAWKTHEGINAEGFDYRGVIYIGLMLTPGGPKVLEYNARFGDPETEVLLPRLDCDLFEVMEAVADKRLEFAGPTWKKEKAVCVVLTSKGYPGDYDTGFEITIPDGLSSTVFHAGTSVKDGTLVTGGGRVLTVTALGNDLEAARSAVYEDIEKIHFEGKSYRSDIGKPLTFCRNNI